MNQITKENVTYFEAFWMPLGAAFGGILAFAVMTNILFIFMELN